MVLSKFKHLWAVALGLVLTTLAIPADAVNVNISSCACATTADFTSAGKSQAFVQNQDNDQIRGGTYVVTSTSKASTAYISVTGTEVMKPAPHWQITAAIPIDANGNSLAGLSESAQEATYYAIDVNLMIADRSYPSVYALTLPPYTTSFITEIAAAYFNSPVTDASNLADNAHNHDFVD
jgi:hypothetical protein